MTPAVERTYTAQLQAGLGMVEETRTLLGLWSPGMDGPQLRQAALQAGSFRNMTARRLRNLVIECFAPRYLRDHAGPARLLQRLLNAVPGRTVEQLMFLYTCRANAILADFVREVYWRAYSAGQATLDNEDARRFVTRANQEGKTATPWSEGTVRAIAGRLTGCCADFGLLEGGVRRVRRILPFRIVPPVAAVLAYDLHFAGLGDNRVAGDPDWGLFGMQAPDTVEELKRLALKRMVTVQTAGAAVRIEWPYKTMDEVADAIADGAV